TNIFNDLDINVLNKKEQNAFIVTYNMPTISTDTDNQFNSSIIFEELITELEHNWRELLDQYPTGQSYLQQFWRIRESWAKIYVFTIFCTGMQSTQQAIQTKLDCDAQHQQFSKYRNALPTRSCQNEIEKYLTSESAFAQNTQIFQSVLYQVSLVETSNNLVSPPKAHEYSEGYLEDEYDALQASLETIIEMVNHENILEIWRVSSFDQHIHSYPYYVIILADNTHICRNAKFDIKLIPSCWYSNPIQVYNSSPIRGTIADHETSIEINQVIFIRGPDIYQPRICKNITQKQEYTHGFGIAKSGLKFAIDNGLVDEFVGLITRFIENHTGINTSQRMEVDITQIENSKKLKHKDILQDLNMEQEETLRPTKHANIEINNDNIQPKSGTRRCRNCHRTGHYNSTCKYSKNHFK
ncbi:41382_t:CDS:2, partial [Gigaspora margarita]